MTKLRYGPRFGQSGAGSYKYNESLDRNMREVASHFAGIYKNLPKYKHELHGHNEHMRQTKIKDALGTGRHDAEVRMEEAIRKVVGILELHMKDMMQHQPINGVRRLVNQIAIHNALYHLRMKCGVKFEAGEYDVLRALDEEHMPTLEERRVSDKIAEQRASRERAREFNMRKVTDRLLARPKS